MHIFLSIKTHNKCMASSIMFPASTTRRHVLAAATNVMLKHSPNTQAHRFSACIHRKILESKEQEPNKLFLSAANAAKEEFFPPSREPVAIPSFSAVAVLMASRELLVSAFTALPLGRLGGAIASVAVFFGSIGLAVLAAIKTKNALILRNGKKCASAAKIADEIEAEINFVSGNF